MGIISRGLNAHGIHIKFSLQTANFFNGLANRRTALASTPDRERERETGEREGRGKRVKKGSTLELSLSFAYETNEASENCLSCAISQGLFKKSAT